MASWKRFSYQWRLFLPLVGLVWLLIGALAYFQYRNELDSNKERVEGELAYVMSRIATEQRDNASPDAFLTFVTRYYDSSPYYSNLRVSIYRRQRPDEGTQFTLIHSEGEVIPAEDYVNFDEDGDAGTRETDANGRITYYKGCTTTDGKYLILLSMQSTLQWVDIFRTKQVMWWTILLLGALATLLVFIYAQVVSRTIRLMRNFAADVVEGRHFDEEANFPHDELGDIARHIIQIYNEKAEAQSRSEKEHEIALHAVKEKMRIKHQLTNNINHELKTPVGVIKGYLDTIAETPDLPETLRNKFINSARQNVDRLTNLLNDVSAMARLEDGGQTIPLSEVDFHDIIFSIDNDLRVTHLAGDLKFSYELPLDCKVLGNANLLNGMISNLIRNAAQHSGGTEIGIKLEAESDKFYSFSFYDNGQGVDEAHLSRLFERFYRVDTGRSRKVGGTGLGLPIVKNTIEAMGGTVSVHNRSTGGLEFRFTLAKWKATEAEQTNRFRL